MKVLEARVNWKEDCANDPSLEILVDRIPEPDTMRYRRSRNLYYAEQDGYVHFYASGPDGRGFCGDSFKLQMKDGNTTILIGPYSSRAGVMNKAGFGSPCIDVAIADNRMCWEKRIMFAGACLVKLVAASKVDFGTQCGDFKFPKGSSFVFQLISKGHDLIYMPAVKTPNDIWTKNDWQSVSKTGDHYLSHDKMAKLLR
jgi:hypothetical protein